jgi:hypothetical protein
MTFRQSSSPPPELPLEPLTADAWQRVEQRVFAELRSAPAHKLSKRASMRDTLCGPGWFRLSWVAASAFALLLTAAWLQNAALKERYATRDQKQVVRVEGVLAELEAQTALSRAGDLWTLERGAAQFRVAPRKRGAPLTVVAGDVRVEVVGTVFRVERCANTVSVATSEGTVRVIQNSVAQLLAAGEHWPQAPSGAHGALVQQPPWPPSAAAEHTASASEGPSPQQSSGVDTDSSARGAPTKARTPKREAGAELQRRRFEEASSLESRDAGAALRAYRRLARESGPWASNALFALARIEVEQRNHADAERDLRQYLERYPDGPNAADARALLAVVHGGPHGQNHAP